MKHKRSPLAKQMRLNRIREVRDLFNHLRKTWHRDMVYKFFQCQYFLVPETVDWFVFTAADDQPAEEKSQLYQQAMQPDFDLRKYI